MRHRPFVDGSRRLGRASVPVFDGLNGRELDAPEDPSFDLVVAVAEGRVECRSVAEELLVCEHTA